MALTQNQKSALKAHLAANTNTVVNTGAGQPIAINLIIPNSPTDVGDNMQNIADWYNGNAVAGDSQPQAAPLNVWKTFVTIQDLNSAIDWSAQVVGADSAAQTVNWLKWQSLCWNNFIDPTDPQVRQGISTIWGNPSTSAGNIGAASKRVGTRLEILLAGAAAGGNLGLGAAARVCGKDANGTSLFGFKINGPQILNVLLNG